MTLILVILLIVLLCGGGFAWGPGYRADHGAGLGGVVGLLLLIVVIVLVLSLTGVVAI